MKFEFLFEFVKFFEVFFLFISTEILQKDSYEIEYEKKSQIYVAKYEKRDIIKIEWR